MPRFIKIQTKNLTSPILAESCKSFLCRLRGLTFRSHISPDEGMLLVQKRNSRIDAAIHMLGVNMQLGIVWIDSDNVIVDTIVARPWRLAYIPCKPAKYVLEIHPDRMKEFIIGNEVQFING